MITVVFIGHSQIEEDNLQYLDSQVRRPIDSMVARYTKQEVKFLSGIDIGYSPQLFAQQAIRKHCTFQPWFAYYQQVDRAVRHQVYSKSVIGGPIHIGRYSVDAKSSYDKKMARYRRDELIFELADVLVLQFSKKDKAIRRLLLGAQQVRMPTWIIDSGSLQSYWRDIRDLEKIK